MLKIIIEILSVYIFKEKVMFKNIHAYFIITKTIIQNSIVNELLYTKMFYQVLTICGKIERINSKTFLKIKLFK